MKNSQLVTLIILDGYGLNESSHGNAIKAANTPNLDSYFAQYPNTAIKASGMDVGLPDGQMGNSEVGHTNIGAGRVVYQELTRITKSIKDGDFFQNPVIIDAMESCKQNDTSLHLIGLVSDGGVHSHNTHLYALLDAAKMKGLTKVYVHAFLDGRDVPPTSGKGFIEDLQKTMDIIGVGKIATVMGRYYAMDRDNRWERVQQAYDAMVMGDGVQCCCPVEAVEDSYKNEIWDEFMLPAVITENGEPISKINNDDSVICFNFRPDRAREITRAFVDEKFDGFVRRKGFLPLDYVCMTQYDKTMPNCRTAFEPDSLTNTFGEYISVMGLKQLRIAETEKYAHVTFFFNGGVEKEYLGEDRVLIPSPKVATYDLKPEMSAYEVTDAVIERINSLEYDLIILNYANCDMVGHTGDFNAAVKAVEVVDECTGRVVETVLKQEGIVLITADHGNADQMLENDSDEVFTAHSTNPVPLILMGSHHKLKPGRLSDLTPTMLELMNIEKPQDMTGESLLAD